ncbi:toprim domain-containing protein, partial [Fibrobacterota bacterium]
VIDWVMKTQGVGFKHAVEILREGDTSLLFVPEKKRKYALSRRLSSPVQAESKDQELLGQVVEYYHKTLKDAPKAMEYLKARGIMNEEAIDTFKLGYSDRSLGRRLPYRQQKGGDEIRTRLQQLGIYRSSGHEHFNGSLGIPVMDENGMVTEMYGRKVLDNLREGTPYHLYLPGPHQGVWNPAALGQREVILYESLIDALSFWTNGFRNVTASYGTEGFTDEMLNALITKGVKRIYIAYDRDDAGDQAAEKLAARLIGEGMEALRIQFPHKMDVNEYIRKVNPPQKSLQLLINTAKWMGKGNVPKSKPTVEEHEQSHAKPHPDAEAST